MIQSHPRAPLNRFVVSSDLPRQVAGKNNAQQLKKAPNQEHPMKPKSILFYLGDGKAYAHSFDGNCMAPDEISKCCQTTFGMQGGRVYIATSKTHSSVEYFTA